MVMKVVIPAMISVFCIGAVRFQMKDFLEHRFLLMTRSAGDVYKPQSRWKTFSQSFDREERTKPILALDNCPLSSRKVGLLTLLPFLREKYD